MLKSPYWVLFIRLCLVGMLLVAVTIWVYEWNAYVHHILLGAE